MDQATFDAARDPVGTKRRALRTQLDAVIAELKSIEQQAEAAGGETALCKQTKILAEVVHALLLRFEPVEEEVKPAFPRPMSNLSPPRFEGRH